MVFPQIGMEEHPGWYQQKTAKVCLKEMVSFVHDNLLWSISIISSVKIHPHFRLRFLLFVEYFVAQNQIGWNLVECPVVCYTVCVYLIYSNKCCPLISTTFGTKKFISAAPEKALQCRCSTCLRDSLIATCKQYWTRQWDWSWVKTPLVKELKSFWREKWWQ